MKKDARYPKQDAGKKIFEKKSISPKFEF
jgi:hypothetical protein